MRPCLTNRPLPATRPQRVFESAFALCVAKSRTSIRRLADQPKSFAFALDGDYCACPEGFFDIGNWTSSFFTGMALLAFRETGDREFLAQLDRLRPWYHDKVHAHAADTMHDLGFLYSLYSVGLSKLTHDPAHALVARRAADVLAARFQPNGGYIRAWGRLDEPNTLYEGLAIIDCLMNLPLLFWAADYPGHAHLRDIAIRHANTTLGLFIRPDDSVFHAFRFDPATGAPLGGDNFCGRSVASHWARGTAWAIYGLALAYRYTRDSRYLHVSERVARQFIANLDTDLVPVWDFRLPASMPPLRDSSAAAIAACGLQELARQGSRDPDLRPVAFKLLERLCTEDYLDSNPATMGILRNAEIGDGVGAAKNAYASWGDYFFMEALSTALGHGPTFW
jgi:unsaturated chondroitin disaccharide hydrolase